MKIFLLACIIDRFTVYIIDSLEIFASKAVTFFLLMAILIEYFIMTKVSTRLALIERSEQVLIVASRQL